MDTTPKIQWSLVGRGTVEEFDAIFSKCFVFMRDKGEADVAVNFFETMSTIFEDDTRKQAYQLRGQVLADIANIASVKKKIGDGDAWKQDGNAETDRELVVSLSQHTKALETTQMKMSECDRLQSGTEGAALLDGAKEIVIEHGTFYCDEKKKFLDGKCGQGMQLSNGGTDSEKWSKPLGKKVKIKKVCEVADSTLLTLDNGAIMGMCNEVALAAKSYKEDCTRFEVDVDEKMMEKATTVTNALSVTWTEWMVLSVYKSSKDGAEKKKKVHKIKAKLSQDLWQKEVDNRVREYAEWVLDNAHLA